MKDNRLRFWLRKLDSLLDWERPGGVLDPVFLALKKLRVGRGNDPSKVTQTDGGGRHGVGTGSFDSSPVSLPIFLNSRVGFGTFSSAFLSSSTGGGGCLPSELEKSGKEVGKSVFWVSEED